VTDAQTTDRRKFINMGTMALRETKSAGAGADETLTVIVSGVGRSGTSMVAKVLDAAGIPMGRTNNLAVYEDQEFLHALLNFDFIQMAKLINARNQAHARWGFKFASIQNHILPPQLLQFRNPHLILVMRDPVAIASRSMFSDAERQTADEAIANVAQQSFDMMNLIQKAECPTLLMSYEKFVAFPEAAIDSISVFCGLALTAEQRAKALAAIEPNNPDYISLFHQDYRGHLDAVAAGHAVGWCAAAEGNEKVTVELLADNIVVARAKADLFREDLRTARIGDGFHAFSLRLPGPGLIGHTILRVRPAGSKMFLDGSGRTIDALSKI
jgi:hypothetical protein